MPDPAELAEAERILKELEAEIVERLERMKDSTTAPALDGTIGRLTYIDEYQQQQMALHGRRKLEAQLERVTAALTRVKEGTYGVCVKCGAAISPERLEVSPETPFCIKCA